MSFSSGSSLLSNVPMPLERIAGKSFSHFLTKTCDVGTQKNCLIEMVLLSTQNICKKSWVRKYLQFYGESFCLLKPVNVPILGFQSLKGG